MFFLGAYFQVTFKYQQAPKPNFNPRPQLYSGPGPNHDREKKRKCNLAGLLQAHGWQQSRSFETAAATEGLTP
jgi:hypothetical protein